MAWTNAFNIGPCAVEVWRSNYLIPPENYAAEGITVETSPAGLVTMTAPDIGGAGEKYEIRIVPSYSTGGRAVRLVIADTPDSGIGYDSPIWSVGDTGVDPFHGFERPFVFEPKSPWSWAGYMAGIQGV